MPGVSSNGKYFSNGLVNGSGCHMVGIDFREERVERLGNGDSPVGIEYRPYDYRITGHVPFFTGQGFYHAATLHFMIVLPCDPVTGAHIWARENCLKESAVVFGLTQDRLC